jgi:steroid 5-alpha reductase family enzyme
VNLPWTIAQATSRAALVDAQWAVQASKTAMETSEATLKLCKHALILDALACLLLVLLVYAFARRA